MKIKVGDRVVAISDYGKLDEIVMEKIDDKTVYCLVVNSLTWQPRFPKKYRECWIRENIDDLFLPVTGVK
jgi:hypothetical protein